MNIAFYLALLGIAALGVVALVLIFWERYRQYRKDLAHQKKYEGENFDEKPEEDFFDDVVVISKASKQSADELIDPNIAELGFSAFDDLLPEVEPIVAPVRQAPKPKVAKPASVEELIVLYVMAPTERPFVGYELLQALLAVGLRYGAMSIFHRHAKTPMGEGAVLFSLASAVEPGVFDIANVGALSCPGLCLFMSTHVEDSRNVFEMMLETAEELAGDLGGILCNEHRAPIAEETIAQHRQRLIEMADSESVMV